MVRYLVIFFILWAVLYSLISGWRSWTRAAAFGLAKTAAISLLAAVLAFLIMVSIVLLF